MKRRFLVILPLFLLLLISCLVSCSSTRGVYITDDINVPLLDISCFESPFEMYQLMEGNVFGDDEYYLEAYSVFDGKNLNIILLTSTGLSVAEINYNGEKTTINSQFFNNSNTVAQYIIFDFQLCYGTFESLYTMLSEYDLQLCETIENGSLIRTVSQNNKLIYKITVSYDIIVVNNLLRGYSYSMELLGENND